MTLEKHSGEEKSNTEIAFSIYFFHSKCTQKFSSKDYRRLLSTAADGHQSWIFDACDSCNKAKLG